MNAPPQNNISDIQAYVAALYEMQRSAKEEREKTTKLVKRCLLTITVAFLLFGTSAVTLLGLMYNTTRDNAELQDAAFSQIVHNTFSSQYSLRDICVNLDCIEKKTRN